ncbi:MAG: hypothetical protein ACI9AO_001845 [Ilumatobacter sp.]|jgi:hypothetical protein
MFGESGTCCIASAADVVASLVLVECRRLGWLAPVLDGVPGEPLNKNMKV